MGLSLNENLVQGMIHRKKMSDKTLDRKTEALAKDSPELAISESDEYRVVGVSYRHDNFERLKQILGKSDGDEAVVGVVLRHEPENQQSVSRCAIAVYSSGLHLGYIPEVSAPIFADLLEKSSGLGRAQARAYFGSNGPNSLSLRIEWPPRFQHDEVKKFELIRLNGDGKYSFPMRTSKYPIYWELLSKRKYPVPELEVGEVFVGDDGLLTAGEFGRSPYFSCRYGYIAKPKVADEYLVNRHLSALGGQARVNYQLIRTGPRSHKLTLDWDLQTKRNPVSSPDSRITFEKHWYDFESQRRTRWPGEIDYENRLIADPDSASREQRSSRSRHGEVIIKVLRFIGKVVLYMTIGLLILAFMVVTGTLKDTLKKK